MFKKILATTIFCVAIALSSCAANRGQIASAPYSKSTNALRPLVFLDPGHGGVETGARQKFPKVEEKRFCLQIALLTKRYLERLGYRVAMTRNKDICVPLKRRVYLANKASAEVFVSLHFNSCPNADVKGLEIYYSEEDGNPKRSKASHQLADLVLSRMIFRTNAPSRGVRKGNFCVIRDTRMPAVLVEGGFVSNKAELMKLKKKDYLDKLAKGIAEGIDRYVRS